MACVRTDFWILLLRFSNSSCNEVESFCGNRGVLWCAVARISETWMMKYWSINIKKYFETFWRLCVFCNCQSAECRTNLLLSASARLHRDALNEASSLSFSILAALQRLRPGRKWHKVKLFLRSRRWAAFSGVNNIFNVKIVFWTEFAEVVWWATEER